MTAPSPGALASGSIYAFYNVGMSLGLCWEQISALRPAEFHARLLRCALYGCDSAAFHTSIAACGYLGELPVLNAVRRLGSVMTWLYALTLWGAIFSTFITSLYNFMPMAREKGQNCYICCRRGRLWNELFKPVGSGALCISYFRTCGSYCCRRNNKGTGEKSWNILHRLRSLWKE